MVKCKTSRDEFIESNLNLVHSLCHRFTGRGIEYDDLFQAGSIGLIKATDAFDEDRGLCFSTYAVPVILGEIKRLFRDGGAVKVSRSLKELSLKATRLREKMSVELDREPTVSELAAALGVTSEDITEAFCVAKPVVSLTIENDEQDTQLDIPVPSVEESLADKLLLSTVLDKLCKNEQMIIEYRYFHAMTQSETAKALGMSQVQVSRAERKILIKLREMLGER